MAGFGMTLQKMLKAAGLKNSTVAKATAYDVSYISKWVGGKVLPAEKNINAVCQALSVCIAAEVFEGDVFNGSFDGRVCKDQEELAAQIKEALLNGYFEDKKNKNASEGSSGRVYSVLPSITVTELIKTNPGSEQLFICDLLSLKHEIRLILAGIENGRFVLTAEHPDKSMSMVIDVSEADADDKECVYNSIFLIHMLTSMSHINFELYNDKIARGKIIYSADGKYMLSGMNAPDNDNILCVQELNDETAIAKAERIVKNSCVQEKLIFKKSSMSELINDEAYTGSMISSNVEWLLGHLTEHVVPQDLYEKVYARCDAKSLPRYGELPRLHRMSQAVAGAADSRIMIYESALMSMASTGELDFFNYHIELDVNERRQVLEFVKQIAETKEIKLVEGGFSSDFQYITNPCLFKSDTDCYVRLENDMYRNNILVLNDRAVKKLFDSFYENIWNGRKDVVISDKDKVIDRIEHYIRSIDYFK